MENPPLFEYFSFLHKNENLVLRFNLEKICRAYIAKNFTYFTMSLFYQRIFLTEFVQQVLGSPNYPSHSVHGLNWINLKIHHFLPWQPNKSIKSNFVWKSSDSNRILNIRWETVASEGNICLKNTIIHCNWRKIFVWKLAFEEQNYFVNPQPCFFLHNVARNNRPPSTLVSSYYKTAPLFSWLYLRRQSGPAMFGSQGSLQKWARKYTGSLNNLGQELFWLPSVVKCREK